MLLLCSFAAAHVPLDVGDWTLTEVHVGPAEAGGQWFELRNNDESDGNNLLEALFRDADGDTFEVTVSVIAHAGEYVVFAASDSTTVGDFPLPAGFDLPAEGGSITLVDHIRGDMDTVAWDASWALPTDAAFAVTHSAETDPAANDLLASWCAASPTPGAENAACAGDTGLDTGGDTGGDTAEDTGGDTGAVDTGADDTGNTGDTQDSATDSGDSDTAADTGSDTASDTGADTGDAATGAPEGGCGCAHTPDLAGGSTLLAGVGGWFCRRRARRPL